jgi:Sec-independent protein translocase protein TatA
MFSFKYLFYGLLIYLLYKVIFDIVLPVSKGVKTVKKNMEEMQRQQAEAFKRAQNAAAQNGTHASSQANSSSSAPKKETLIEAEYIDFEEVKK